MVTPGSRFLDDLYAMYLVGIGWFILPVYGQGVALVLPSDYPGFDGALDVVAAVIGFVAVWWGARGGPLSASRAAVIHELGSPASRRSLLLPRLGRQTLVASMTAAVVGAFLLAINGGLSLGFGTQAVVSGVCATTAAGAVFQAAVWLVVFHARSGPRVLLGLAAAVLPLGVAVFVGLGGTLSSLPGLGLLAAAATASGVLATVALRWVPVDRLWRRAAALESMRSSLQTFDFQRVLLDLRSAGEPPVPGGLRMTRAWMPLALWRQLATMQHGFAHRALRVGAAAAAVAVVVFFAEAREGLVLLVLAACCGFIGIEFSGPVAATADHVVFGVHYPRGSAPVLRTQVATMLALTVGIGALAVGWQWAEPSREALVVLLLCGYGGLGAAVQARLGSPNLGAFVDVAGFAAIGPLLWARAMVGPAILLFGAVALSHHWLRPSAEASPAWGVVAVLAVAIAAVVATWPLEKDPR